MRKIRFIGLTIISFAVTLVATFFIPGAFINRLLSTVMCAVFSFNFGACTANLAQNYGQVVAAFPPTLEKNIDNWFTQRSGEFDDEPSPPAPVNNQQVPPFPVDPGPNIIRPEFDDPGSVQPNKPEIRPQVDTPNPIQPIQEQPTLSSPEGIWIYTIYAAPSPDYVILSKPVKISNTGNETTVSVCENCEQSQLPANFFSSKIPQDQALTADFTNIESTSIEIIESTDGAAIWGVIYDQKSPQKFYFTLGKLPNNDIQNKRAINSELSQIQNTILPNNMITTFINYSNFKSEKLTNPAIGGEILMSQGGCIPPSWLSNYSKWFTNYKNKELQKTAEIIGEFKREQYVTTHLIGQEVANRNYAEKVIRQIGQLYKNWTAKIDQVFPDNSHIALKEYKQKNLEYNQLWTTTSFPKQEPHIVAQCIPPQVLGVLGRLSGLAALATLIAVMAILAEWCINNPKGCELLLREPERLLPTPRPQVVPGGGGSDGDPHLTTMDGQKYDYQAVGEFVLTRTKNRQFEIQVRQAPFKNINTAAINVAVAMKVGDARVGIYATGFPDDQTTIPLRIDGKPVELKGTQNLAGGGSITHNGGTSWTVQWPTGEVATFEISGVGDSSLLDISTGVTENDRGQLEGLLGNFNGNTSDDFMTRDGRVIPQNQEAMETARSVLNNFNINRWVPIPIDPLTEAFLEQIHSQFGNSWRISQSESLFDYAPGKNTGTFTNPAFPNGFVILRMLAPDAVAKAEEACRVAEVPSDRLEGCLFDVAVTGETGFARVAANFLKNKVRERVEQEIRNRIPIPVPLPF